MSRRPSRREFAQTVVYTTLGSYLAFSTGACRREPTLRRKSGAHAFFTEAQFLTVSAACERLLPRDEDPGAIDLGVPVYVDRALAYDDYKHWSERFPHALAALDRDAQEACGQPFHLASADVQDDILEDWEDGNEDQREFLQRLLHLTLEGAFGDPSHGGNKDGEGWRLIGFHPGDPMPGMHHHGGKA